MWGLGFMVQGSGIRVWGLGIRVQGVGDGLDLDGAHDDAHIGSVYSRRIEFGSCTMGK